MTSFRILFIAFIAFTNICYAQKENQQNSIQLHENLHQKLVIEAYNLLKAQYGSDIPIMEDHLGTAAYASYPFWYDQIVSGAHGEDYQDVVFGYTSTVLPWPIDWDLVRSDPYVGKFRAIRTPIPGDSGQRLFSPFHFPLI